MTDEEVCRYVEAMNEWMSREELVLVRKELGSPEQIVERVRATKLLLERHEQWKGVMTFLYRMTAAVMAFLAFLAALKTILPAGWWP